MKRIFSKSKYKIDLRSQLYLLLVISLAAITSCRVLHPVTPTPLPGWYSPVSDLFVDISNFPEGWQIGVVNGDTTDSTINHIGREWEGGKSSLAYQSIWRAYTVADAKKKYDELLESQFIPKRTSPYDKYVPFEPPIEIDFHAQSADEFYLACGWWSSAYCEVIARYHNYVTEMRLDLKTENGGNVSDGLTYPQIKAVLEAMDAKFADFLEAFPLSTSTP
jgi:hypothetical protein